MQPTKARGARKGPAKGTKCLVIDRESQFYGQIVTVLSDPHALDEANEAGDLKPGDVVNDLEYCANGVRGALSHLLIPIPPPAKAARMFGEERAVTQ